MPLSNGALSLSFQIIANFATASDQGGRSRCEYCSPVAPPTGRMSNGRHFNRPIRAVGGTTALRYRFTAWPLPPHRLAFRC